MAESARVKGEEPREMCDASQRNVQRAVPRFHVGVADTRPKNRDRQTDAKVNVSANVAEYGK